MPTSAFNKLITKKKPNKKNLSEILSPIGEIVLPDSTKERREKLQTQKKDRMEAKHMNDKKRYSRSLDRITVAKQIQEDLNIPFLQVCAWLEENNTVGKKLVNTKRKEMVMMRFGDN